MKRMNFTTIKQDTQIASIRHHSNSAKHIGVHMQALVYIAKDNSTEILVACAYVCVACVVL